MEQPTSKPCTKCGVVKPFSGFTKGAGRYGLRSWCIACKAQQLVDWRKNHPGHPRKHYVRPKRPKGSRPNGKYNPAYYAATREIRLARKAAYRKRLKERTPEQVAQDQARLRPDGVKVCSKCRAALPLDAFYRHLIAADGLTSRCRKCASRRRLLHQGTLDWWAQNGMDPNVCTYCGTDVNYLGKNPDASQLHVDHIVPRCRGGSDEPENLAPACAWCNISKGARCLADWLDAAA